MSSPDILELPEHVGRALRKFSLWEPKSNLPAFWEVGCGHWAGIMWVEAGFIPWTYDPHEGPTLHTSLGTDHMMEAIRRAADEGDNAWMADEPEPDAAGLDARVEAESIAVCACGFNEALCGHKQEVGACKQ